MLVMDNELKRDKKITFMKILLIDDNRDLLSITKDFIEKSIDDFNDYIDKCIKKSLNTN